MQICDTQTGLLSALEDLSLRARQFDESDADPRRMLAPLVDAGVFRGVVPLASPSGPATSPDRVGQLHDLLRRIGGANASAGRLFEGHVNAVQLVFAYGDASQRSRIAQAVSNGALMGVWNAEVPPGVRLQGPPGRRVLRGDKIYASGVGVIDAPLITARNEAGEVLMTVPTAARTAPFDLASWRMRGMRATASGTVRLDDVPVAEEEIVGGPGDYYRSPGFHGGAWRFATVQFGAMEEIVRLMAEGLKTRGRSADPHQRARMGRAVIAVETARLWTRHAAEVVERGEGGAAAADAAGGMARLVVERGALEVIELAERALGLMAFAEAEPIERIARDLATYLRQPFPDAVLEHLGEWGLNR